MLNLHSSLNTTTVAVGESFAVATIVGTWGSAPHPRGTSMLAYVGAMGSRTSHDSRMRELRAAAVPEKALATLHSPIGLDLQAATPGEVAIGIAAEIIASRSSLATGAALSTLSGLIHGGDPGSTSANEASRQPATPEAPAWT